MQANQPQQPSQAQHGMMNGLATRNTCAGCGITISRQAERCRDCARKALPRPPKPRL